MFDVGICESTFVLIQPTLLFTVKHRIQAPVIRPSLSTSASKQCSLCLVATTPSRPGSKHTETMNLLA